MQGTHDGSWSLRASANGEYVPQSTPAFSNFSIHQPIRYNYQTQQQKLNFPRPQFGGNVEVIRIDNAVNKTRNSLISAGENVSSTRVWQLVQLQQLQADSLGMHMQDVPSLRQLMFLEGKIIAFMHCFVGARGIVTLYDLEVAICRNEGVGCFDDLGLGPLLQHPLVLLYFPSFSGSAGLIRITSEEIFSFLDSYLNTCDIDDVQVDEFLNFVAVRKSVTSKEKLGVRIQNSRMYVSFIQDAKKQEGETLKILLTELHQKYRILSPKEQEQDEDYCGKHTRFNSLSSEDDDDDAEEINVNSYDRFSSCPYPSVAEEIKRLGSSSKKRKAESRIREKSDFHKLLRRDPSELRRGHAKQEIPKLADDSDAKQLFSLSEADFTQSEGALRLFVSTWKDTCKELSMSMFVEKVLSTYNLGGSEVQAHIKRAKVMSSFPFNGLLHVAKELVTEALEEQIPTEITDTNLVAGYDGCAGTTSSRANKPNQSCPMSMKSGSTSGNLVHEWNNSVSRDRQFHTGTPWAAQAQQTGRKGEEIAYRYFAEKYGKKALVRWVNEQSETGLPYDLVIENRGGKKEYVEVKATVSTGKDYFNLTMNEWQFANEKGESYVIAHVLLGNSNAILTQHRNLVKLCQEGHLRLLILMPNQRNEVNVSL